MESFTEKNIWIIGAGSGIGYALALELDKRGASLILSSRDKDKLDKLNSEMSSRHLVIPCDVTDEENLAQALAQIQSVNAKLDSVLFLAGIYQPMKLDSLDIKFAHAIVDSNFTGALNLIHAVLPALLNQKFGQLAICASVAGYRGLPNSQPYSATKAALINLTESLRAEMSHRGLDVRLITPGFVRTPMTDKNSFPMPMMIEADMAAKALADGLLSNDFEIHFPKRFTWIMKIIRLLPSYLYFKVIPR